MKSSPLRRKKCVTDLFNSQGGKCGYCKCHMRIELGFENSVTKDHIIPKSKGGNSKPHNLVGACYSCNQLKGNSDVLSFIVAMGFGDKTYKMFKNKTNPFVEFNNMAAVKKPRQNRQLSLFVA